MTTVTAGVLLPRYNWGDASKQFVKQFEEEKERLIWVVKMCLKVLKFPFIGRLLIKIGFIGRFVASVTLVCNDLLNLIPGINIASAVPTTVDNLIGWPLAVITVYSTARIIHIRKDYNRKVDLLNRMRANR